MPAEQKQVQAVTPNRGNAAAALQIAGDQLEKAKTVSQKPSVIAVPAGGNSPAPKGGSASPISTPMAPRVPSPARKAQEKDFKI